MEIVVFVADGCANCRAQIGVVEAAVRKLGLDAVVVPCSDVVRAISAGVLGFPGIVVDGVVVSEARPLDLEQVCDLLTQVGPKGLS